MHVRRAFAFCILIAVLGLAGCGQGPGRARRESGAAAADASAVPPAWRADRFAGRITAVRSAPGHLEVDLALPDDPAAAFNPAGFNLCLPENQKYALRARLYGSAAVMLDTEARGVSPAAPGQPDLASTSSLTLHFAGVMRDAAIWRLMLNEPFWRPWIGRHVGRPGELWATVEIDWPVGAEPSKAPAGATPAGERGMGRVLRQFVANPGDLGKWPVKNPPPAKGLSIATTDPRPLAPGAGPRMRFRIDRDGLYRLTANDLGSGTPSSALENAVDTGTTIPERARTFALPGLDRVRIFTQGKAVPLHRTRVGGDETILFYGWASRTPYDSKQNYWLTVAPAGQARQEWPETSVTLGHSRQEWPTIERPTLRKVARLDRDNVLKIAHAEFMRIVDATWVDCELVKDTTLTLPLALAAPVPTSATATLKSVFTFYPEGDPALWTGTEAELSHEGRPLTRFTFTPNDPSFARPVDLPAAIFSGGQTTLTLAVTRATTATLPTEDNKEGIWFDKAAVDYEGYPALADGRLILDTDAVTSHTTGTLYEVALHGRPLPAEATCAFAVSPRSREARRIPVTRGRVDFMLDGGWRAEVYDAAAAPAPALEPVAWPDDLLADPGADVLILTHAMFLDTVTSLTQLHARMGLKTRVVDVQQVYDRFSDGMTSPLALRAYLGYAAAHWKGGAPQYLILLGDCSEDALDRYRSKARNLVPSYTYVLGEEQWPSDYWYSLIAGEDMLPDLIVARLPAASVADARETIAKTVRYAGTKRLGLWRGRLSLVADNLQDYRKMAETARLEYTPPEISVPRLYLDELSLEDNWYVARRRIDNEPVEAEESIRKVSAAATNKLKDLLNEGTPVLEYIGHGSPNLWGHERIWFGGGSDRRDTQYLKNDGRYAFIINYTCATGKIDYPIEPWNVCIAEDFLRTAGGGAIGLFVPSGFGSPPLQEALMRQWHGALFRDRLRGMGELATLVRARYAAEQASESHLFMYQLLGDPTLDLQLAADWRGLDVTPAAVAPGAAQVRASLKGIEPARGKARIWLENERGDVVWEGAPFDYADGAIDAPVDLPAGLESPQRLRVGLYAWNDAAGRELLAAGTVALERPAVRVRAARAERAGNGRLRFAIDLENDSAVAADEIKLSVLPAPAAGAALAGQTLKLAPGERRRIELIVAQASSLHFEGRQDACATCFEAVVITPRPPDDPGVAFPLRWRFALAPDPKWLGWVPALGYFRDNPGVHADEVAVCALSAVKPAGPLCAVWRAAAGDQATTIPLKFAPLDGAFVSSVTLPTTMERKPGPRDVVELVSPVPGAEPRVLGRMSLGELPREAPRLKLDLQSIRHRPASPSPTDGETIFVSFTVTNEGNAPSPPCQPALLNKPCGEGGRPLPFRSVYPKTALPALGPGRSAAVTLRWDPIDNAGVQSIVVDADPVGRRTADTLAEQTSPYRIFVRTKSRLARGKPLPPVRVGEGLFKLRVEVVNEGETDAHNVEVNYFRTSEKKPEGLLGTVLLKVVPAAKDGKSGTATATLECKVDEAADRPVSEVRLKGSAQTITE